MRALFVIPSGDGIYGSSRSLSLLTKNLDYDYDIVVGKSLIHKYCEKDIRGSFGNEHLNRVYFKWLPNFNCYEGYESDIAIKGAVCHKWFMWNIEKKAFYDLLDRNNYNYIHLNSIILSPLIRSQYPMYIHIREYFKGNQSVLNKEKKNISNARGVIYIDKACNDRLNNINNNYIILRNPFDMRNVYKVDINETLKQYCINANATIFSIIGRYSEIKGNEFVAKAFHQYENENAVMMIVGDIDKAQEKKCRELSENDVRIRYMHVLNDMAPVYAISDYVIRGDSVFPGDARTVYEGLYSGCSIILPGDEQIDSKKMAEYEEFKENICFYKIRDMQDLEKVLSQCGKMKKQELMGKSDVDEYKKKFDKFVLKTT